MQKKKKRYVNAVDAIYRKDASTRSTAPMIRRWWQSSDFPRIYSTCICRAYLRRKILEDERDHSQ